MYPESGDKVAVLGEIPRYTDGYGPPRDGSNIPVFVAGQGVLNVPPDTIVAWPPTGDAGSNHGNVEELVRSILAEKRLSEREFSKLMRRPAPTVWAVIDGESEMTPEFALDLEDALGYSAEFWMSLEARNRIATARREREKHHKALPPLP